MNPSFDSTPNNESLSFPLDSTKYELHQLIGRGSTATVYSARCLTNNQEVAIKLINLEVCPIEIDSLRAEIAFWSTCDHPNVVKYYGSFVEQSILYIIMEYMNMGSISEIMKFGFRNGIPRENVIAAILRDILQVLDYFHSNNKIHRDIKTGNILVNQKGEIKIGDFGIAANLVERGQRLRARFTVIGTPCYMAPEVIVSQNGYSEKADIWSLGITAIELATGTAPYSDLHPLEVIVRISDSPPPCLPDHNGTSESIHPSSANPPIILDFSSSFKEFVRLALQKQPEKRPSAADLLNTKFIKQACSDEELSVIFKSIPTIDQQYSIMHSSANSQQIKILEEQRRDRALSAPPPKPTDIKSMKDKTSSDVSAGNTTDTQNDGDSSQQTSTSVQQTMMKPDGIKAEWDFSSVENDPTESSHNNDKTQPVVVQKGKFRITKQSSTSNLENAVNAGSICISHGDLRNQPHVSAKPNAIKLVADIKKRMNIIRQKISDLKIENQELNSKLDYLTQGLQILKS